MGDDSTPEPSHELSDEDLDQVIGGLGSDFYKLKGEA